MRIAFLFTIISFIFLTTSCEEQQVMVPEFQAPTSERTVLLEELTGVRCPNCPSGALVVEDLKAKYGDRLIPVGVHGGFLTIPLDNDESKYDFRNPFSFALESYLEVGPKPGGAINRVRHTAELANSNPSTWSQYIDVELAKEHVMGLFVATEYDAVTRVVDIIVTAIPLKDFSQEDNLHISLMIIQNEIEDGQEDPFTIIHDYEHNHVLRTMLTDALGDPINGDLESNQTMNFNYSYTLPTDDQLENTVGGNIPHAPFIAEHIEVVAAIHSKVGTEKDVLQAAFAHLTE